MHSRIRCRYLVLLLPVVFLLSLSAVLTAGEDNNVLRLKPMPEPTEIATSTILSPTQDTILYDNNTAAYLDTTLDAWTEVRFTPLYDFELQAIYFAILNQYNNTTDGCSLYVVADDGSGEPDWPSGILASAWVPPPLPDMVWMQVDLTSPINFLAYEDFHVIYGPAPGGPYPGTGWWSLLDSDSTTTQRSYVSHDNRQTWLAINFSDAFIRAGGEYISIGYTWSSNGPTEISVISLAIHPTAPETIYAGTAGRGIYVSTDGGGSWAVLPTQVDTLHITTIAINPQNTDVIYAGVAQGFEETGVYKSTNGGVSWTQTSSGIDGLDIETLAIDPAHPDTLYAGIFLDWESGFGNGVYRTYDGGGSWSQVALGMEPVADLVITSLVVDPAATQTLLAGAYLNPMLGTSNAGIFKSTNQGNTWSTSSQGFGSLLVTDLAMDPDNSSIIYATTADSLLFKSVDGGNSWFRPSSLVIRYLSSIAIDPSNSQRIFFGTEDQGVYMSEDGGVNWQNINVGLGDLNINAMDIVHVSTTILFVGTDDGVWRCDISEERRRK